MFRKTLPFKECFQTKQPVTALGPNAHALSKIDLLVHACIHRIAHGRNTERNRLIWLYDIHLMVETMGDDERNEFLNKVQQRAVAVLCADALETCQAIFNTRLPEGFLVKLKANFKNEPSAKLINAAKLRWAWEDMQSLGSISEKVAFARELLFC